MYLWQFACLDSDGLHQYFQVKARTKDAAIKKAFKKAERIARGTITHWECKLITMF